MSKKIKAVIIAVAGLILLSVLFLFVANTNKMAILGYHGFTDEKTSDNQFVMTQKNFENQIKYLSDHGYKSLTMKEFICWKNKECKQPRKSVLITMDDGYANNYRVAFPILKKYKMNATVFVIGQYLDGDGSYYLNNEQLESSKKEYPNIEFASHSFELHEEYGLTDERLSKDIDKMKKHIYSDTYAYPHGIFTESHIKVLKDKGYKMAFTFGNSGVKHRKVKITDDNYKIPRLSMTNGMPMWKFKLRLILPI